MPEISKRPLSTIITYQIGTKHVEYDAHAHIISVQWQEEEELIRINIPLTPTELVIIKALLDATYQKEADLEQEIYARRSMPAYDQSQSHPITKKHIANLRPKLQPAKLAILRIIGFGYILKDIDTL